jgi:hypothetical protein
MIGDVVGRPGRQILEDKLRPLIDEREIDLVVVNGENAAGGSGILPRHVRAFHEWGADVVTTGDHIWKQAKVVEYINGDVPLLRPANFPPAAAGRGFDVFPARNGCPVGVLNLIGRVYMHALPVNCPFAAADAALDALAGRARVVLVDIHAEATSEKIAMGWHLDGRASAVVGTHTHVVTADEIVLPGGTAYITDVGMTGPHRSVIGRQVDKVLHRFTTGMYAHFAVAHGDVRLNGALIAVDPETGRATDIERVTVRADA